MTTDLYREEILEHYKEPLNFGKLKKYDVHAKQLNPFCGDEIELFLAIEKGVVLDIGFVGTGCAISIASTSILTDHVKSKKINELTKFSDEAMLELLAIDISETRKKCALLGFAVLKDCLENKVKSHKS